MPRSATRSATSPNKTSAASKPLAGQQLLPFADEPSFALEPGYAKSVAARLKPPRSRRASSKATNAAATPSTETIKLPRRSKQVDPRLPLVFHALAVAGRRAKPLRDKLTVGDDQAFDFICRLSGKLDVAGRSGGTHTIAPSAEQVLAAALDCVDAIAFKSFCRRLETRLKRFALGKELRLPRDARDAAAELVTGASRQEKTKKAGAVTGSVRVELLEGPRAVALAQTKPIKRRAS